ncbi:hypothetical protein B0T13DRAFT_136764 [Neurospora crassa]|nr:hypothetical protein B0T13DRAFT_136764 [Neurospora crassa]
MCAKVGETMPPQEVTRVYSTTKMDVISWGARSTTTVAQWRPISSYGVSASSKGVVAADGIRNDRIKMSRCRGAISREPSDYVDLLES